MCDTWSLTFDPVTSKSTLLIYYPGWMCDESSRTVPWSSWVINRTHFFYNWPSWP